MSRNASELAGRLAREAEISMGTIAMATDPTDRKTLLKK